MYLAALPLYEAYCKISRHLKNAFTFVGMPDTPTNLKTQASLLYIFKLAWPMAVSIFIPQLSMLCNSLFLGNYVPSTNQIGTQHILAASGIGGIYILTLTMIGFGLSSGLLMLMSRKAGENDRLAIGGLMNQGYLLTLAFSLTLILISVFLAPTLLQWGIHDPIIRRASLEFIGIRYWSLPFLFLNQLHQQFFLATSQSRRIMVPAVTHATVNIFFDYALIYGHFNFSEMGLAGAAWASCLADISAACGGMIMMRNVSDRKSYRILRGLVIESKLIWYILLKSSPLIVQYVLSIGAWLIFYMLVEHIGPAASAASQILRSVFGIVGVAAWALGATCNSMVSNLIGQNRQEEIIPLILKIIRLSLLCAMVIGTPLLIFPKWFLTHMTSDPMTIETGIMSLRIVILATWILSVSTVCFNGVVGTGNTRVNMYIEMIAIVLYLTYTFQVVEFWHLSLPWAWCSEFVYWTSLLAMSAWYLKSSKWKQTHP